MALAARGRFAHGQHVDFELRPGGQNHAVVAPAPIIVERAHEGGPPLVLRVNYGPDGFGETEIISFADERLQSKYPTLNGAAGRIPTALRHHVWSERLVQGVCGGDESCGYRSSTSSRGRRKLR